VRTPREKRERILDEYERSGMSAAAFAALFVASWIQQRRKGRAEHAPPTDGDWVLVIDADGQNYPPPGSAPESDQNRLSRARLSP
jgi:hypothetical protein